MAPCVLPICHVQGTQHDTTTKVHSKENHGLRIPFYHPRHQVNCTLLPHVVVRWRTNLSFKYEWPSRLAIWEATTSGPRNQNRNHFQTMIKDSRLGNETREWLISNLQEASTNMHGNLRLKQLHSLAAEASSTNYLVQNSDSHLQHAVSCIKTTHVDSRRLLHSQQTLPAVCRPLL